MLLQCGGRNDSSTSEGPSPATNHQGWRNNPEASLSKNPPGILRPKNPGWCGAGYRGQYEVAPSILPHRCQDQFMAKLHKELGQCLVRAGLCDVMGTAQPLSRGRSCLWAHSSSWARSPSAETRRNEGAKQLRGDSLMRSSWPCSRCSSSRTWQHQSQSLRHKQPRKAPPGAYLRRPHMYTSLSPRPPWPHCADKWLHCSLSKLHL